jgi:ABC-2 type transport system ATP-binding protein
MSHTQTAILAEDIHKHYTGGLPGAGLNGFNLSVQAGTVCGLLGPNGAGKTTAVKILATLLNPDAGRAVVAGFDVRTQARQVRQRIGLVGQYAAVDEVLTCHQNLMLFGRLNHLSSRQARQRADELLEQFHLAAGMPASKLSGGMRRRLDLAVSLIVSPAVLFVDEPTTGLDPASRREVWDAIRALVSSGTTALLTTQYLEEADHLAHHIAMLKEGRVISEGTPDELKSRFGMDWLDIVFAEADDMDAAKALLLPVAAGEIQVDAANSRMSIPVSNRIGALIAASEALSTAGIELHDLTVRRPTLDEVFLSLTKDQEAVL